MTKKTSLFLFVLTIVFFNISVIDIEAKEDGWVQKNGENYYYKDGNLLEGFQTIEGKTYFFGIGTKRLLYGWQNYEGKFYADEETGEIKEGWQHIGVEDYYIKDNHTVEGFQTIEGKTYFFGIGSNRLLHGWQNYRGKFYANEETGEIKEGWQHIGTEDYYIKDNHTVEGFQTIEGKTYFFGIGSNRLLHGWQNYEGKFYADEETGEIKEGWQHIGVEDYYIKDNHTVEGFQTIEGKTYFFGIGSNRLLHGWQNYEGKFYADEETGEIKEGWQHIGTEDYYIKDNHTVEGFQTIEDKTYFFGISSNRLLRGWQNYKGKFYANEETGEIKEGWLTINNNQYYTLNNYILLGVNTVDNKNYYFDSTGKLVTKTGNTQTRKYIIDEETYEVLKLQYIPVYYNQKDLKWSNKKYGQKLFGSTGCAPTSMAMAFTSIKEKQILPTDVADYLYNKTNEYNKKESGTSGMGIIYATREFNINIIPITSKEQLIAELSSGKIVYAAMGNGKFATPRWNHAILIYDYEDNKAKTMASDPLNIDNNGLVDIDTIWKEKSEDPDDISGGAALYALY